VVNGAFVQKAFILGTLIPRTIRPVALIPPRIYPVGHFSHVALIPMGFHLKAIHPRAIGLNPRGIDPGILILVALIPRDQYLYDKPTGMKAPGMNTPPKSADLPLRILANS